jgi:hypothetical protein
MERRHPCRPVCFFFALRISGLSGLGCIGQLCAGRFDGGEESFVDWRRFLLVSLVEMTGTRTVEIKHTKVLAWCLLTTRE